LAPAARLGPKVTAVTITFTDVERLAYSGGVYTPLVLPQDHCGYAQ